jgi:hypothetical protein
MDVDINVDELSAGKDTPMSPMPSLTSSISTKFDSASPPYHLSHHETKSKAFSDLPVSLIGSDECAIVIREDNDSELQIMNKKVHTPGHRLQQLTETPVDDKEIRLSLGCILSVDKDHMTMKTTQLPFSQAIMLPRLDSGSSP